MTKNTVLIFIITSFFMVLVAVNGVFISSYVKAAKIADSGTVFNAEIIEIVSKAEGGRRLSTYRFITPDGVSEYSLKERLKPNDSVNLLVSSMDKTRAFEVDGEASWIKIYNGLTGGLFITLALIASHLAVLVLTVKSFKTLYKELVKTLRPGTTL